MQQASDCDKILVHDDDLLMIDGIGNGTVSGLLNSGGIVSCRWQSLVTLEPDVMMNLLGKSNLKIHEFWCGRL